MSLWMAYALMTLAFWGITGLTQKLSTNYISVELSLLWFSAAFLPIAGVILWWQRLDWHISTMAWFLAILGGILNGLGVLTSFAAFRNGGKASVVTPLIALYPVVTVVLAVPFLHEHVSRRELLGIVLALAATAALSYEGDNNRDVQTRSPAGPSSTAVD
jgi:bacterial/archaeal transporter family protein